jgi:hypothetical protein
MVARDNGIVTMTAMNPAQIVRSTS